MKPKGFAVIGGYMGLMPNGRYQLFETEGEYIEFIKEDEEDEQFKRRNVKRNGSDGKKHNGRTEL